MGGDASSARDRPSIYDVALRAGVSHMTVSRVINDHPNIRASTRQRVKDVIAEVGYRPSPIAQALASRHSRRIGVIVDAADHYGPKHTLLAIEKAARGVGYTVATFSMSGWEEASVREALADLSRHGVDAVCMIAPRRSSLDALTAAPLAVPAIVIGDVDAGPALTTVAVDQGHGAALVADHLVVLGHRSMLHLSGPPDWIDASAREQSWRREMDARGLVSQVVVGDWTSDSGYEIGARHPLVNHVTAIFASNDQMALGLLHGLSTRGIRVPQDLALVGYDDAPESRHLLPPLTTVRQDFDAAGTAALRAVLTAIDGGSVEARQRVMPQLVVRASSGTALSGSDPARSKTSSSARTVSSGGVNRPR
ncbi:MAG TPA: LacI family DNA-binding transcriptional regulator [Microbacterium sp.]|nr:LacI family DNA-binding transcriptional regulator [Microbacterium sp.]